jgi:hypothetical protein
LDAAVGICGDKGSLGLALSPGLSGRGHFTALGQPGLSLPTVGSPPTNFTPYCRRKSMNRKLVKTIALGTFALVVAPGAWGQAQAADAKTPYPSMAPLDQYLMADRNAEIALAQSAAPESISRDAEVIVLGRHGYETAVKGRNGFVCMVERSWTAGIDEPDFWNPKLRGAICFNPPAARTVIPITLKRTELVLAGRSKAQMSEGIKDAFDKKELPTLEPGSMCYMMSRQVRID